MSNLRNGISPASGGSQKYSIYKNGKGEKSPIF
jgi:hypothetical protein